MTIGVQIDIRPGDSAWEDARPLSEIVWSPQIMAGKSWRHIVWAHADERVMIRDGRMTPPIVCHVGLYFRNVLWNGRDVRAAGVGGVATHPDCRRRGYASMAMRTAAERFRDDGADFGLLFCEPHNFALYGGLGWREFTGEIYAEQPGSRVRFDAMTPFVLDLKHAPRDGTIDLRGLPW